MKTGFFPPGGKPPTMSLTNGQTLIRHINVASVSVVRDSGLRACIKQARGCLVKAFISAISALAMSVVQTAALREERQTARTNVSSNIKRKRTRWLLFATLIASLIGISFGLAYLLQNLLSPFESMLHGFAWLAYLSLFLAMLVGNLTIVAPVPVTMAIMIAAASRWDPLLVALFASLGGSLGELSDYYVGYIGKKSIVSGSTDVNGRIAGWMNRYGLWAVFFLAVQPALPFDVAGIIAGASKMPLGKFLAALWTGKFIKYIVACYFGSGLLHLLPS